jgi:hypothetical protein
MRRWWLAIALLLSLGVNLGIVSIVLLQRLRQQPPLARDLPGVGRGIERLADHLHLEGEHRRRFIELQRRFFFETREQRGRLAELRRRLREELTSPRPDRQRLDETLGAVNRATAELDRSLVSLVLETREILSRPQQREYFRFLARLRMGEPPVGGRRPGRRERRPFRAPPEQRPEPPPGPDRGGGDPTDR